MKRTEAIERLRRFEPRLRAMGATSLYLFGSTARDEARPDSDIDLFIELDPAVSFTLLDLVGAKLLVEDDLKIPVEVATRDDLHPRMRDEIEREAVRIY